MHEAADASAPCDISRQLIADGVEAHFKKFKVLIRGTCACGLSFEPKCSRWGDLEFPLPFGRTMTSAEDYIHSLDGKTGASLKLSILNPKVRSLHPSPGLALALLSGPL